MLRLLILALTWIFLTQEGAAAPLTKVSEQCLCKREVHDPFEVPVVFNFGKFKDQCIDSCRNRPAHILKISKPYQIEVANILHYGDFYRTLIDLNRIESVSVGFEEFLPGISHVFLKFDFAPVHSPLILANQAQNKSSPIETRELVISAEGVPPKGHSYSLIESYFGNYLMAYRILTGSEMLRQAGEKNNKVRFYPLSLTKDQTAAALRQALKTSDYLKLENIYQLFSNNCATTALGFIESSFIESGKGPLINPKGSLTKFESALPIFGPIGTHHVMSSLNLFK